MLFSGSVQTYHESTKLSDSNVICYNTFLSIGDLEWNSGIRDRDYTHPLILSTGSGYSYDINDSQIHFLETTGTYDVWVGTYAEVPVTDDILAITLEGRAKANQPEAARLKVRIYDPNTKRELVYWTSISSLSVPDSDFRFFNKTFLLEGYESVLLFFYYGDAWTGDQNQEFWVRDLKIYTDVSKESMFTDEIVSVFKTNSSEPLGLQWHDDYLWTPSLESKMFYQYNPESGEVINKWSFPDFNPWNLATDGDYFYTMEEQSSTVYKLNQNFSIHSSIETPATCRGGIVYDGENLWIANNNDKLISRVNLLTGNLISSYSTIGYNPRGLVFDGEYLWVCDKVSERILVVFPENGTVSESYKISNLTPWGITMDKDGFVWITDWTTSLIYKLNLDNETNNTDGRTSTLYNNSYSVYLALMVLTLIVFRRDSKR
jgi:sugar lactone lactonase YvrE